MSTTKTIQGQYYNMKWSRDNLFKITPLTTPATVKIFYVPENQDLNYYLAAGCRATIYKSTDMKNWTEVPFKDKNYNFLDNKYITINEPTYFKLDCADENNNPIFGIWTVKTENNHTTKRLQRLTINCTEDYTISGSLRGLVGGFPVVSNYYYYDGNRRDGFSGGAFEGAFAGDTHLVDASNLNMWFDEFDANYTGTVPDVRCYFKDMFKGCTGLVTGPTVYLPRHSDDTELTVNKIVTKLDSSCESMFEGCSSLTSIGGLPNPYVGKATYKRMFTDCTSLNVCPALPAVFCKYERYNAQHTLMDSLVPIDIYLQMFKNCTSLRQIPELPSTWLTKNCYAQMFSGIPNIYYGTDPLYAYPFRIPTTGTAVLDPGAESTDEEWTENYNYPTYEMFSIYDEVQQAYTRKGTLDINTQYYTSARVISAE